MEFQLSEGALQRVQQYKQQRVLLAQYMQSLSDAIGLTVRVEWQQQKGIALPDEMQLRVDDRGVVSFFDKDGTPWVQVEGGTK